MTTLEIPINKSRFATLALLLVLIILMGLAFSYYLYLDGEFSPKLLVVLIFAIPWMFYYVLSNCKKIYDKKPGLVLDSRGFLDNMYLTELGIVPWSNISDVRIIKFQHSEFLVVQLKNNEAVLSRLKGFNKRIAK